MIKKVRIDRVNGSLLQRSGMDLFIKREDEIHEKISGNKWRKLKYNLKFAQEQKFDGLLTLGGAYSNHIAAVACAAKLYGFQSIGLIRGKEHLPLNPTLQSAKNDGMTLFYIDPQEYRELKTLAPKQILQQFETNNHYFIPEGGTNDFAIQGCAEIITELDAFDYDYVCVCIGTGGTMAGMLKGMEGQKKLLGFSALKGDFVDDMMENLLNRFEIHHKNYTIHKDYHFGGYAKHKPELIAFINDFKAEHQIQLDPIYTVKMLYGIYDLIEKNYFPRGSKILAIHTGGLQGIKGFNERFGGIIR